MQLANIVPLDRIEASLGRSLQIKKVNGTDWRELLAQTPAKTLGIAMHAWHRLVQSGKPKVDPMMMRAYFEREDPELAGAIEGLIGQPLVRDFGLMKRPHSGGVRGTKSSLTAPGGQTMPSKH
jgi:hypothetical protein